MTEIKPHNELTKDELIEISENHIELCEKLHELMDSLPPKVAEELHDLVYRSFEP